MCDRFDRDDVELVRRAQRGDQRSLDRLAEEAGRRLSPYLFRLTLNQDLAQDLLQDTLLKMVESIEDLEHPDRFWPWLFRTAMGQVQHYYRDRARAHEIEFSRAGRERFQDHITRDHDDGLTWLMREELTKAVVATMADLSLSYRNVLTLRCFEQMSYAQIADVMECKELRARVLFFRAKQLLRRRLTKRGFDKGLLLTGLGLFGLLTTLADSASAGGIVSAASMQVGAVATVTAVVGTPKGAAVVLTVAGMTVTLTFQHFLLFSLIVAGVLLISAISVFSE